MNQYAIVDSSGLLTAYVQTDDPKALKANTPPGSRNFLAEVKYPVGTTRFDSSNKVIVVLNAVVETAAQALTRMLDDIDEEREMNMMYSYTGGGAKKYEYAEKAREVRDYRTLAGTVIAGLLLPLNIAGTRERFGWSMAEVDETGDTLEVVISRYEAAISKTVSSRKIAARAQKLKRAIRAATPDKREAIFNARSWAV